MTTKPVDDLSPSDEELLTSMSCPEVYCVNIEDRRQREHLRKLELIEWVPGQAWSGQHTYALTDKGRELVKAFS